MPVNDTLSTFSDMAYATSVVVYIAAMLLYFGEFAYGRAPVIRKRETALVNAGGTDAGTDTGKPVVGHVATPEKRPLSERFAPVQASVTAVTLTGAPPGEERGRPARVRPSLPPSAPLAAARTDRDGRDRSAWCLGGER